MLEEWSLGFGISEETVSAPEFELKVVSPEIRM
jgi:hypothetical protein